ncbi:MAG: ribonuclease Z [Ginsengibacter sp.]
MLAVTILGSNSAVPAHNRHPTAQVVQSNGQKFLVDCGEGTLLRMMHFKIKPLKIDHIFISHLHGDHYFGLPGMLTTMGLNQRSKDLHIYSPKYLEEIIELQLKVANATLPYKIHFHTIEDEGVIAETKDIIIESFKVKHRIECWGFLFREKKNPRKIDESQIMGSQIPVTFYEKLQAGEDFISSSGNIIANHLLTVTGDIPKTYAYCADTVYFEPIADKVMNADLLYHESTYLHELEEKAVSRFHSTAKHAAMIARKANAKKLLLGHFSSMYDVLDDFQSEAEEIFENTECAKEGVCYIV